MPRTRPCLLSLSCLIVGAALAACHSQANDAGGGTTGGGTTGGSGTVDGGPGLPASYTATLKVLSAGGQAVAGAQINVGASTLSSDQDGNISVPSLPTQGQQAAVVTKAGFMALPVQLAYADAGQKTKTVVLHTPQILATFASGQAVTVDLHTHAVAFAQSSFQDANGTPYTGTVHLAADALDPTTQVFTRYAGITTFALRDDFDPDSLPSGALFMQDKTGRAQTVLPEAMVNIDATQDDGSALHLNAQTPATVTLALTPYTRHAVGEALPMMSYDANQTRWVQQGNCTVQAQSAPKTGLECVGTVSHFSAVAVAASNSDGKFQCGNVNVTLDANLTEPKVWLEEIIAGNTVTRSAHTAPLTPQMLCYVGATSATRVAVEAKVGSSTRIFRSPTLGMQPSVMAGQDLDELQAGDPVHACFRCPVLNVSFAATDGTAAADADGDGYYADGALADCNDHDASVHPNAVETVCDVVDKNCDGTTPPGAVTLAAASSHAEWNTVLCKLSCAQKAAESPGNDVDENCDGIVSDRDGDGYYNALDPAFSLALAADANTRADCDDQNPSIHPGGRELAGNKLDEDCDGFIVDADNDGYIARTQAQLDLSTVDGLSNSPPADLYNDCDDWDASVNPNQNDLTRESVFAQFYAALDANVGATRSASLCAFIGADGALNAAGKSLLIDVNCDGYYSDLDGDGYTVPGDTRKGDDHTGDCDDVDPRRSTASGCPAAASAAFDAGSCTPKAAPPSPPMQPGSFYVSSFDIDGATLTATPVYNPNGPVTYTVWYQVGSFTGLDANTLAAHAKHGDPYSDTSYIDQYSLTGGTSYAITLVAQDSTGARVVYPVKTFRTKPGYLSVGNYNDSFVDPNSVTSTSAVFTFHAATGGTGNYSYTVYLQQGYFRDSSRGSIQAGTLVAQPLTAGQVPLTGLTPGSHYQVAAIVDDGNMQVAYYLQDFTTLPDTGGSTAGGSTPPGGNTAGGSTSFSPYLSEQPSGGGFQPSARQESP